MENFCVTPPYLLFELTEPEDPTGDFTFIDDFDAITQGLEAYTCRDHHFVCFDAEGQVIEIEYEELSGLVIPTPTGEYDLDKLISMLETTARLYSNDPDYYCPLYKPGNLVSLFMAVGGICPADMDEGKQGLATGSNARWPHYHRCTKGKRGYIPLGQGMSRVRPHGTARATIKEAYPWTGLSGIGFKIATKRIHLHIEHCARGQNLSMDQGLKTGRSGQCQT